jgi:diadenosine tetraphosphate (Ap4A) HIT family hydrolase
MSESAAPDCPLCNVPAERIVSASAEAVALLDAYPVSPGHTLIVTRRHVASFFELTAAEVLALHELLFRMQQQLQAEYSPQGYNIGVNVGRTAGQTIMHVHVHLVPRYPGDVPDPTGGVRNIIPGRGRYP